MGLKSFLLQISGSETEINIVLIVISVITILFSQIPPTLAFPYLAPFIFFLPEAAFTLK